MSERTVLVTGSGGAAGLNALRSLRESGENLRLVASDCDPLAPFFFTDLPDSRFIVPRADDPEYIPCIKELVERERIDVILPTVDEEVLALSGALDELEEIGARILIPERDIVSRAVDKLELLKLASRKVDTPKFLVPNGPEDLEDLGEKLVVKPRVGRGARGIHYADSPGEAWAVFSKDPSRFLVSEYIPGGPVYTISLLYDHEGELIAGVVLRKLRERPETGGVAWAGETVPPEDYLDFGKDVVEAIGGWRGIISIEAKLDSRDGRLKLMEANPRIFGYNYLATRAGINMPLLYVKLALGERVEPRFEYKVGMKFVRVCEDVVFE